MTQQAQTNQASERLTVTLPAELRPVLEANRRSLEQQTGLRVTLSQAAAAAVRNGAQPLK